MVVVGVAAKPSRAGCVYAEAYPELVRQLAHSVGLMRSRIAPALRAVASMVRCSAARSRCLSLAKSGSIGFRSGL